MNYDQLIEEIKDLIADGKDELAKCVLREIYATGLKDGKEIAGWKK